MTGLDAQLPARRALPIGGAELKLAGKRTLAIAGAMLAMVTATLMIAGGRGHAPEEEFGATRDSRVASHSTSEPMAGASHESRKTPNLPTDPGALRRENQSHAAQSDVLTDLREMSKAATSTLERVRADEVKAVALDDSVVGLPFPFADEAKPYCNGGENPECADARRLHDFADEARDIEWAASAENALRALVEQRNSGFTIRNLECRLVSCMLEVTSPTSLFTAKHDLKYNDQIAYKLAYGGTRAARLIDASGVPQYLTLQMYERIR